MEGVSPLGGLVQISTDLYKRSALLQIRFRGGGVLRDYSLAKQARQHKEFIILAFPNTAKLCPQQTLWAYIVFKKLLHGVRESRKKISCQ